MGYMRDQARQALAEDILNDAEVMQEFEDSLWIKVDREMWQEFMAEEQDNG